MVIDNIEAAQKALESISYYRLSGYSYPFRQYDKESRTRSDQFSPKTNLEQVLALYRFDERLRTTTFQELSRIEVNLSRSQEDFIKHYDKTYAGKLPIWVAVHILQWGQLALLFEMAPIHCQDSIADSLHLSRSQVNSWLDILRILRNICAHQGRLFNRTLRKAKLPDNAHDLGIIGLSAENNKCFDQLTLVQYLTRTMGLGDGTALPSVLATFPATDIVPLRATGTPDNWQSLPLWACEPTT